MGAVAGAFQINRHEFEVMFATDKAVGTPQLPAGASTHLIERVLTASCVPQFAFVFKWYLTTPAVEPEVQIKGVTPLARTAVPVALVMVR